MIDSSTIKSRMFQNCLCIVKLPSESKRIIPLQMLFSSLALFDFINLSLLFATKI